MERYKLLSSWVIQALVDNPEIIKQSTTAVEVYSELYEIWLEDCQKALKSTIKEIAPEIKGE